MAFLCRGGASLSPVQCSTTNCGAPAHVNCPDYRESYTAMSCLINGTTSPSKGGLFLSLVRSLPHAPATTEKQTRFASLPTTDDAAPTSSVAIFALRTLLSWRAFSRAVFMALTA